MAGEGQLGQVLALVCSFIRVYLLKSICWAQPWVHGRPPGSLLSQAGPLVGGGRENEQVNQ